MLHQQKKYYRHRNYYKGCNGFLKNIIEDVDKEFFTTFLVENLIDNTF